MNINTAAFINKRRQAAISKNQPPSTCRHCCSGDCSMHRLPAGEAEAFGWVRQEPKNDLKQMRKTVIFSILFLLSSGCASIYTQTTDPYSKEIHDCTDPEFIPNIYSGVIFDVYGLPAENAGFFCLIDLPLSAVVDTIILPYTIHKQIKQGNWFSQSRCERLRKERQSTED